MDADLFCRINIEPIVVEKKYFPGFTSQGMDYLLKGVRIRLDLARDMRREMVVKSLFQLEFFHQTGPMQNTGVSQSGPRESCWYAAHKFPGAGVETAQPATKTTYKLFTPHRERQFLNDLVGKPLWPGAPSLKISDCRGAQPQLQELIRCKFVPHPGKDRGNALQLD